MGEDSSHAERCSVSSSSGPSSPLQPQGDRAELLTPSFGGNSAPSSPVGTLARMGFKLSPTSPTSPGADRGQVSAITVVALLDKLVNMLDAVQDNQRRMESRQAELEGAVRLVQGDVSRLTKTHASTAGSVGKLLERSRKVGDGMKEVRERMDKQATAVKRLESNHHNLLKRNHFKVLIFQEDSEIPSTVVVKDSLKSPLPRQFDADSVLPAPSVTGSVEANVGTDEGLQTISLSSDEDEVLHVREEDVFLESEALAAGTSSTLERSRAEKLKRSSLKKVDSIKKAFSRQSIEKKMTKIGTKIVPPERREKIKKSFTPNHPKSPTSQSSSFKVSPMTFNVKKVRDSGVPAQDGGSPGKMAHVEIPTLGSMDGEASMAEVHPLCEGLEVQVVDALLAPSTPESLKGEHVVNGDSGRMEGADLSCSLTPGLALPEQDDEDGEDGEEEQEEEKEQHEVAVNGAADIAADVAADVTTDIAADVSTDVAADVSTDVAADIAANVTADVAADVAADVTADVTADVMANVAANNVVSMAAVAVQQAS